MSILKNIKSNKVSELKEAKLKLANELKSLQIEYNNTVEQLNNKNAETSSLGNKLIGDIVCVFIGVMLWQFGTKSERYTISENFFLSFLQAFGPLIGTFFLLGGVIEGFKALFKYSSRSSEASSISNKVNKLFAQKENLNEELKISEEVIRQYGN